MEKIIIKELKLTPRKAVLKFRISDHDPYNREVTFDKPLPERISSHVDAIAAFVKKEADDLLEEDLKQEDLPLDEEPEEEPEESETPDEEEVKVPEEGVTGESDESSEEELAEDEPEDWTNVAIPIIENTEVPAFKAMEKGHLIWYINNAEKDTLIEDINFNFGKSLSADASIEVVREQSIELATKELKL
jgi:hypothetical protein